MEPIFFRSAAEFRAWLKRHGTRETELWIGFYKKSAPQRGITYREALDEALCVGWIDGLLRRIDEHAHQQRWTPRRPSSIWSAVNIKRVGELTADGRMQPAGLAAFERRTAARSGVYSFENQPLAFEPSREQRFKANGAAWAFFTAQAPSYQRKIRFWVESAVKEETRDRRLDELIERSASGLWAKQALQKPPKSSRAMKGAATTKAPTPGRSATAVTSVPAATKKSVGKDGKAVKDSQAATISQATQATRAARATKAGKATKTAKAASSRKTAKRQAGSPRTR